MKNEKDYLLSKEDILKKYEIKDLEEGLTEEVAMKRLEQYGYNQLKSETTPKWSIFVRQFNNVIIYILMVSALLTLWMGHLSDGLIIGLVVIVNASIGYFQEVSASNALEKIKAMLTSEATVYRDCLRKDIPSLELAIGDVVFLEAGDNIPADLRIVESDNLRVQESSLTGEIDSIDKTVDKLENPDMPLAERSNIAFASTSVTNGSGKGVVIATGEHTELGKISQQVKNTNQRKTPLMREIDQLGKGITYVIIAVAIGLFVLNFFSETYSLSALSLAVITMIVGSIPEGLPATTSVVLAMGVSDMAKNKHTIVKSLPAVETLGSVNVVTTDKTGTLTKNEMTVKEIVLLDKTYQVSGNGYEPKGDILMNGQPVTVDEQLNLFLVSGYEANDTTLVLEDGTWIINGEPTDGAFLTLYHKVFKMQDIPAYDEIDMLPFDSNYRYIAKLVKTNTSKNLLFIKGSPDKLLSMAKKSGKSYNEEYWQGHVDRLSSKGQRVVAVGYKEVSLDVNEITHELLESGIELLGVAGIIDPPREEVISVLKEMNHAGIEVKMITGDHPVTAKKIGQMLGLAPNIQVVTGAQLDAMGKEEYKKAVLDYQVFARTTPKNKLEIVEALQANNLVTAMTGDGVNDASALKKADIGVAMGIKGTDVAKDSADMILADDNFGTMSIAIKEGRRIYDNIKKSILFLLPTSFAEGLIIAFTIIMQKEMPLQPTQLLWINMVSAITIQFAFIFEPAESGIMDRTPRKSSNRFLNRRDIIQIAYVSVLIAIVALLSHEWFLSQGVNKNVAATLMINIIVMCKIFYLFNVRSSSPAISKDFFTNKKAFVIIGIMLMLQLLLTYVPFMHVLFYTESISFIGWLIAIGAGILILTITEIDKVIRLRKKV
jgi:magnesium-transporting ATPase (P-type)